MGKIGAIPHNYKGYFVQSDLKNIHIHLPDHPNADSKGNVLESVLVASWALGKPLPKGAVVHHINGNRFNNNPSNLVICQNRAYHNLLHLREKALKACGHADWRKCQFCQKWDAPEKLTIRLKRNGKTSEAFHKDCRNANRRERWRVYGKN